MKVSVLLLFVFCITSIYSLNKWEDCGIPLTRKIYFQNVVVSPANINLVQQTSESHSISVNIGAEIQNYDLGKRSTVSAYIQLMKDGALYIETLAGDLCDILKKANGVECVLPAGGYSFSYKYQLPPLPTGDYTFKLTLKEDTTGSEIGCLSVQTHVIGLGVDACSYTSSLDASFQGKAHFLESDSVIQIGPRGLGGMDTKYEWGTFKSITASADLVGYAFKPEHYVWGLSGSLTNPNSNVFEGFVVIGYLPNPANYENAQLIYQGLFSWTMTPQDPDTPNAPPFIFESGRFDFVPKYFYPSEFPYPLNIGNVGNLTLSQSSDRSHFTISASKNWCRCNCDLGGEGTDNLLGGKSGKSSKNGMSAFQKGTIAVAVVGSCIVVLAVLFIVKMRRSRPRPVVYDEADLMDPQKPDYGTMAINEAFEAEDQEYA